MRVSSSTEPKPAYVSLGDSMSIDDYAGGDGCGAASLLFRNRDEDFPEWIGRDFASRYPGSVFIGAARDGATSEAVRFIQIPELRKREQTVGLITLTIGGNDLLQSYGSDAQARIACQRLADNGDALLADLHYTFGKDVPIILSTIYDPSDGTGDTAALQIASWPTVLEWINAYNNVLRRLAAKFDAVLVTHSLNFGGTDLTLAIRQRARRGRQIVISTTAESLSRTPGAQAPCASSGGTQSHERRVRNYAIGKDISAVGRRGQKPHP